MAVPARTLDVISLWQGRTFLSASVCLLSLRCLHLLQAGLWTGTGQWQAHSTWLQSAYLLLAHRTDVSLLSQGFTLQGLAPPSSDQVCSVVGA